MNRILFWQKVFITITIIAFILMPLSILLNAGLVLLGALVLWPTEACLHALAIIVGIVLLIFLPRYKEVVPKYRLRFSMLIFLTVLHVLILAVGGGLTYLIMAVLKQV